MNFNILFLMGNQAIFIILSVNKITTETPESK